jgi:hypothetical protein
MENVTYAQVLALIQKVSEQSAETDKQIAETDKQIKAFFIEADKRAAETSKRFIETDKLIKAIGKQVGDVTDTLGRFAEEQVRPKILKLFKARGIALEEIYPRVVVKKDGHFLLEIDLLLVNTIYCVVVEVKNTLRQKDVDEHLERMQKLQTSHNRIVKGTTMYGAVAGMIVTDEVEKYAIKKGFYVIKPKGDNVKISNKKNFEPQKWEVMNE